MKKAVIIGVGAEQGLGAQLAKRFASEGLHVFVASRSQSRLDALTVEIEQDQMEGAKRRSARQLAKRGKIAGFRPGRGRLLLLLLCLPFYLSPLLAPRPCQGRRQMGTLWQLLRRRP